MQLLAPDIVIEARGLSLSVCLFFFLAGFLLWLFGWRWHRFWMGMAITIAGGLAGLQAARASGSNLLALGLLLAISAGALALELSRILAFLAGGMCCWLVAVHLVPGAQELWIAFLIGGLTGVLLYRLWMMLLTSFVGVLLTWHAGLVLAERYARIDAPEWVGGQPLLIQIAMIVCTVLGLVAQSLLERWHLKREKARKLAAEEKIREAERDRVLSELPPAPPPPPPPPPPKLGVLGKLFSGG
jgi:heme exporter protein D